MANGSSGDFRHQGTVLAPTNAPLGGESAIAGRSVGFVSVRFPWADNSHSLIWCPPVWYLLAGLLVGCEPASAPTVTSKKGQTHTYHP